MRAAFAALSLGILLAAFLLLRSGSDKSSQVSLAGAGPLLTAGKVAGIHVKKGDTVRFRIRSAGAEEVHVHGYDIKKDVAAGKVASMSFKATIDGIFVIEFEHSGTQIASLRVDP
jgi:hypothetical protein